MLFCIDIADSLDALARWWRNHNRYAHLLPEHERSMVIAAKDRRKEELSHEKASHRVA